MSKEEKKEVKRLKLQADFLAKAINKFGKTMDFSKVYYVDRNTEVCVYCKKHNLEFWIKPSVLLGKETKYGCPECRKEMLKRQHTLIDQEEFIRRSREKFPGKFDYSETLFVDMNTPVILICNIHGRILQTPKTHLNSKHGCPECALQNTRLTQEEFIRRSILKYGNKFDFSKTKFINFTTPVIIICPIHGEFSVLPKIFLADQVIYGCPKCGNSKKGDWMRVSEEEFLKKCEYIYGVGRFDFSRMNFIDMSKEVCIICHEKDPITGKEHWEFWVSPTRFINDNLGCPQCSSGLKQSKGEFFIETFLKQHDISFKSNVRNTEIFGRTQNYVYIDFCFIYLSKEIWIEYNGGQHYKYEKFFHESYEDYLNQKRRDANVRKYCEENNIFLIEIPYFYKNQAEINDLLEKIIINGEFDYKIKTPKQQ